MKIEGYKMPKSSFLSVEKDMDIIIDLLIKNNRLKKLLYHTVPYPLEENNLTQEQTDELLHRNILKVPKIYIDSDIINYLVIKFDNFLPSKNPEFRNNIIEFDIICHMEQWEIGDGELRPYKIAGEIDSMLNQKRLTGIGELEFLSCAQIMINSEFAGLCLRYGAVHGEEDKKFIPNPDADEQFVKDFKEFIDAIE